MTRVNRKNQVMAIKQWYEYGGGKHLIEKLLPDHAATIEQYYKIPQNINDERLAGVYYFEFVQGTYRNVSYVGQSGNIAWRFLEHLYNFFNGVTDWGVPAEAVLNEDIKIEWTGIPGTTDRFCREADEARLISYMKPFLQYTDPTSDEYGNDKKQYGRTREEIKPDICVCSYLRKARAKKLFSL